METSKIVNGEYDLNRDSYLQLEEGDRGGQHVTRDCSPEDSDLILESMLFATELLTTGTIQRCGFYAAFIKLLWPLLTHVI